MTTRYRVDRLWPDPEADLDLDAAFANLALPDAPGGRPWIGVNMVTSIDGRAQLAGSAEGLAGRADRRLMRLLRVPYDAVASGAGTLRATGDLWLSLPADLAARRVERGLPPQPVAIVVAGASPVPLSGSWVRREQRRILVVGRDNPHAAEPERLPPGLDLVVAPDPVPDVRWLLARLREDGVGSILVEGGPHFNAALLAADAIDDLHWTVGPILLGSDALRMIAPAPAASRERPRRGHILSVHRDADDLFIAYRFD